MYVYMYIHLHMYTRTCTYPPTHPPLSLKLTENFFNYMNFNYKSVKYYHYPCTCIIQR